MITYRGHLLLRHDPFELDAFESGARANDDLARDERTYRAHLRHAVRERRDDVAVTGQRSLAEGFDADMPGECDHRRSQRLVEPFEDRQRDQQCSRAEHDAEDGNAGDEADESIAAAWRE